MIRSYSPHHFSPALVFRLSQAESAGGGFGEAVGASGDSRILRDDAFAERILGEKQTVMRPKVTLVGLTKAVCSKYSIKEENWRDRAEIADYRKLEGWRPG